MATRAATTGRGAIVAAETRAAFSRGLAVAAGLALLVVATVIVAALASYGPRDPSFDTVTGRVPQNLLGAPGAWAADALLFAAGYMVVALVPALVVGGTRLLRRKGLANWRRYTLATLAGTLLAAGAVGALWPDPDAALPAGSGGLAGLVAANAGDALGSIAALSALPVTSLLALVLAMLALPL
ncbi:MAG: DNA translocase FtsK 4TM domain-containing protein, partial [Janthinobacterium lividum]